MDVDGLKYKSQVSYTDHDELKNVRVGQFSMSKDENLISNCLYYIFDTADIKLIYNYADVISEEIDNITHSLLDFQIHPEIQGSILIVDNVKIYNDNVENSIDLAIDTLEHLCNHALEDGSEIISLNSEHISFSKEDFNRSELSLKLRENMYRPIKQQKYDFIFVKYLDDEK